MESSKKSLLKISIYKKVLGGQRAGSFDVSTHDWVESVSSNDGMEPPLVVRGAAEFFSTLIVSQTTILCLQGT